MASKVKTGKVRKGFKKLEKDPAIAELAVAVYQKPLQSGLRHRLEGVTWAPNSPEWLARKKGKGWGQKPWVRTGKTLKALTNNAPMKLGTKKGIKVGVDWRKSWAFAVPRTFTEGDGKTRISAKRQDQVAMTLKRGGVIAKLKAAADKRGGRLMDYLELASGLVATDRRVRMVERGKTGIPPRPLFSWVREWYPDVERDIEKTAKRLMREAGFKVK